MKTFKKILIMSLLSNFAFAEAGVGGGNGPDQIGISIPNHLDRGIRVSALAEASNQCVSEFVEEFHELISDEELGSIDCSYDILEMHFETQIAGLKELHSQCRNISNQDSQSSIVLNNNRRSQHSIIQFNYSYEQAASITGVELALFNYFNREMVVGYSSHDNYFDLLKEEFEGQIKSIIPGVTYRSVIVDSDYTTVGVYLEDEMVATDIQLTRYESEPFALYAHYDDPSISRRYWATSPSEITVDHNDFKSCIESKIVELL